MDRRTVLLADDHEDFLAVAARHLEPHFEVIKAVGDGQALLDQAARLEPAKKLRATGSLARIVFLTMHADPDYVRAALATGALGYVLKSRLASDLLSSMREALAGRLFVSPSIAL